MKSRRNKYGNKRARCYAKHTHDSKAEARYCNVLLARKKDGEILGYKTQVSFELLPAFKDATGKKHRAVNYVADFVVHHEGKTEIVDVKGVETKMFKLKWKWLKSKLRGHPEYLFTIKKNV